MASRGFQSALDDFRRARQQAALQETLARLQGQSTELLSYEEVYRKLKAAGSAERGLREIPLDAIVGSVGRTTDFTRTFLPRLDSDEQRWAKIKSLVEGAGAGLPPIEVYQIGEAYFVLDGHHRVSVARQTGQTHIQAHVIEVRAKVPLSSEARPDELILKAEYAEFLELTRLDQLRSNVDLSVSVPGQYAKLENHIEVHRYFMEVERDGDAPYHEAVCDWYDRAYLPVVRSFREKGLLRGFPGRTETDLYLWVVEYQRELHEELGWEIKPEVAASRLAARLSAKTGPLRRRLLEAVLPRVLEDGPAPGEWRQTKLEARYTDRLFADILVAVSGDEASWMALDQALMVAYREDAQLHGLHVTPTEALKESPQAQLVRAEFNRRCEAIGIKGVLALESGEVAAKICDRALLADLVVLHLAYPPPTQTLARLESGFRAIIRRCARPVLAVPGVRTSLGRALLAFDGSPKAKEALFVATYLADLWTIGLVVVTVAEAGRTTAGTLAYARDYLEMHEVQAEFVEATGAVTPAILRTVEERKCDLILIGGYGASPVVEAVLGSSVDEVLREARVPVLICR
jgi:nucleotide-binding universal stress UspA family protein